MKNRIGRWVLVASLAGLGACVLQTETVSGPKGDEGKPGTPGAKGDPGSPGEAGAPDPAALAALQAEIDDLKKRIADPSCPTGYVRDPNELADAPPPVHCQKGSPVYDEVVKVGTGGSAFWIDRYEASVWQNADGSGLQYGTSAKDYPASFPRNGQRTPTFVELYAVSKSDVLPSSYPTWFQAQQACRASAKRLPTGEEWVAAASGTNDPGSNDGSGGACVTNAAGLRKTGQGVTCVSGWGAQDMIGNLREFTAEWYAAPGDGDGINNAKSNWGDPQYGGDGTWNLVSGASGNGSALQNIPAAAVRGGDYTGGVSAGVFALNLGNTPVRSDSLNGFRCVIPR